MIFRIKKKIKIKKTSTECQLCTKHMLASQFAAE